MANSFGIGQTTGIGDHSFQILNLGQDRHLCGLAINLALDHAATAKIKTVCTITQPCQCLCVLPHCVLKGHKTVADDGDRMVVACGPIFGSTDGKAVPFTFKYSF